MLSDIATLNALSARALDSDRLEEWPGFFMERCLYKVTTAENFARGYQAGLIDAETEGLVAAETSFIVVRTMRDGQMMVFAAGVYLDRIGRDADGALRYAERIVVCDSQRIDTLLAIPL